jgi:hypothetical protein
MARELNVKPEEVIEMETRLSGGDVLLDPPVRRRRRGLWPHRLPDRHSTSPRAMIEARQRDVLAQPTASPPRWNPLDERSRRIVEERWLKVNDDSSGGMTLHELAAEYGVSAERIRQIEVAAMKKMKKALAELRLTGAGACSGSLSVQPPFSNSFNLCRQRLGTAAIAREQAQLALGVVHIAARGMVHGVAGGRLAPAPSCNRTLNSLASAAVCRAWAQGQEGRVEVGDVGLEHLGRVALGVHRDEDALHAFAVRTQHACLRPSASSAIDVGQTSGHWV